MASFKITHMRNQIRDLTLENRELKAKLKSYDEKNFISLVDETIKMNNEYKALIKEVSDTKNEYEHLLLDQKKIMLGYEKDIGTVK